MAALRSWLLLLLRALSFNWIVWLFRQVDEGGRGSLVVPRLPYSMPHVRPPVTVMMMVVMMVTVRVGSGGVNNVAVMVMMVVVVMRAATAVVLGRSERRAWADATLFGRRIAHKEGRTSLCCNRHGGGRRRTVSGCDTEPGGVTVRVRVKWTLVMLAQEAGDGNLNNVWRCVVENLYTPSTAHFPGDQVIQGHCRPVIESAEKESSLRGCSVSSYLVVPEVARGTGREVRVAGDCPPRTEEDVKELLLGLRPVEFHERGNEGVECRCQGEIGGQIGRQE